MDDDAADEPKGTARDAQGIGRYEREEWTLGGGRTHQRGAGHRWAETTEFVAKVARGNDSPFIVLDLEESEPGEAHGVRGVVENICAVLAAQDHVAELDVGSERSLEGSEARGAAVMLAGDIGANHIYERQDPELVFARDAARHRVPDAKTKD